MQTRPVPSVSVVMPAYNAEKYLREAIDSILAQTYKDFEFIIINDGSTDRTKEIILSYSDPRIVYLENEENSGICVTLNKGLDAARGRYIARMDADDIALPDRFALQVDYMDKHENVGVCGSLVERFYNDSDQEHDYPSSETDFIQCKADLLFSTCVAHPSVIIRKSILLENNLRYEDFFRGMEDYQLWWKISRYAFITNIPIVLLKYRIHKNQVTQIPLNEDFLSRLKVFIKQRLIDLGIEPSEGDINAIMHYEISASSFDDNELENFIQCLRKILKQIKSDPKYYKALQFTAGKAISYSFDLSSNNMKKSNLYYMWRSYHLSCMPLLWFVKRIYYILK